MIAGIGIDILELDHMTSVCQKQPRFPERILTAEELELYHARSEKRKNEFLAGRFAAKEAFSKAMGTGIGKTVTFQNISILNDEVGRPVVVESPFDGIVHLSISHSQTTAAAQVVLEHTD